MSDCIFCKLISGELPAAKLYEDTDFLVILDRFPANEGHALVLTKEHYPTIFSLPPALGGRLFSLAVEVSQVMEKTLGLCHMNVMQNNGTVAGQTVPHFHMHLIPRYENDGIVITSRPLSVTNEQITAMQDRLAAALAVHTSAKDKE